MLVLSAKLLVVREAAGRCLEEQELVAHGMELLQATTPHFEVLMGTTLHFEVVPDLSCAKTTGLS
jgi:hypothetical protein